MKVTAYTKNSEIQYFEIIAEPWEYFLLQDAVFEYGNDKAHEYRLLDQLRTIKMNEEFFKKEIIPIPEKQPKKRFNFPIKKKSK